MPYCPKCGKEVSEKENFCPGCGTNLRRERVPSRRTWTEIVEKKEKEEKAEKSEKQEKREKEEVSPVAPFVGGVILIFAGVISFLATTGVISLREVWPHLLVFLGLIIILVAIYAGITASKRTPRP